MPHVILSQARIHDHLLSVMSQNGMEPSYSRRMKGLSISENAAEDYPVSVTLERTEDGHEAEVEEVRAKYVVGCDGARSAVRK